MNFKVEKFFTVKNLILSKQITLQKNLLKKPSRNRVKYLNRCIFSRWTRSRCYFAPIGTKKAVNLKNRKIENYYNWNARKFGDIYQAPKIAFFRCFFKCLLLH